MSEKKKYSYVRKSVVWEGKQYEVRGKTEKEALEKLAELKASLKRGEKVVGENSTVDRWYKEWKETYKVPAGITAKSLQMYDEKYNGYIGPVIGKMKLKNVRDIHLQKILNEQAGTSFSHVTKLRMVMQGMFRQARLSRLIVFDPAEGLQLPEYVKRSHRAITEEEREHILAVAETHRAGLWVLTILYAGLRPGETAVLLWKDIDFEANEIHVYKAAESGTGDIKGPKTSAGVRDIPIAPELRRRFLQVRGEPFDPVFTNTKGDRLNADSLQRMWKSFVRSLDIHMGATVKRNRIVEHKIAEDLTAYCLRHTFCTDLQRKGVPINIAKELMGHSDIAVTANIYTHRDQAVLHTAMERAWEEKNENGKTQGKSIAVSR